MGNSINWLADFSLPDSCALVDGLVPVKGYCKGNRPPEEVVIMEKAEYYGADAVFFEAPKDGKPAVAYSAASRPPIPIEVGHPFRFKPATHSV